MKDAVATMGGLLPDDAGGRDAVHVAVFSATSDEKLFAGQDVAIVEQGERDAKVSATKGGDLVAVVDPFLKTAVQPGARFWAYLYPRTITALSHRWSHPSFEATDSVYVVPAQKLDAEKALREWAGAADCPGYEWFIGECARLADGKVDSWDREYMMVHGSDAHGEIPNWVWPMAEVVLGRPIKGEKPEYFSCSC